MSAAFIEVGMRVCLAFSDRLDILLKDPEPDVALVGQAVTDAFSLLADQLSLELGIDARVFVFQAVFAQGEARRAAERAKKGAP